MVPLLFGPYYPPACKKGDWLDDEIVGRVEVAGWTTAPISWPRRKQPGLPVLILTPELVRAIKMESCMAVAYWWNVSTGKVGMWRKQLGVGRNTPGTLKLCADHLVPPSPEACALARAAINANPEIRQRIAEKKRGVPHSVEAKAKISAAGKGKPKPPGWGAKANQWMLAGKKRKKPQ